jgi:SpoIID/LytB domain protein
MVEVGGPWRTGGWWVVISNTPTSMGLRRGELSSGFKVRSGDFSSSFCEEIIILSTKALCPLSHCGDFFSLLSEVMIMMGEMLRAMSTALCLFVGVGLLIQLSCAPAVYLPPPPEPPVEPTIRVGLLQDVDQVFFSASTGFRVVDEDGQVLFSSGSSGRQWSVRVKFGQPASVVYRLVLHEETEMEEARRRAQELRDLGFQPSIVESGMELRLGNRPINDNRKYWVTLGPYTTEEEASSQVETLPWGTMRLVIPDILTPPLGVLDLVDPLGQVVLSQGAPLILVSKDIDEGTFTIYQITVGRGFAWERQEDRSYRGRMEFRIGNDGKITAINELSLESYLRGLLPKEMNPGFPPAALRAQAIAARSYSIGKLGIQHRLEPFDLCADVHCQAYGGAGMEDPATNRAVDETRGQVILYGDDVCEAFYSAVCGGHTENPSNVWGSPPTPYLKGRFDAPAEVASQLPRPLETEAAVRAWVTATPNVFCNHLSEEAPRALHYTRRHFRWSFTYSRRELEEILAQKTGRQIGHLLDIIPLTRGPSGRLIKVRIVGEDDEIEVERELNIRRVLSSSHLPSACFTVEKEMGPDGLPATFVFRGAGWGHGVGMCQAGAAGMALRGLDHRAILSHYYQGALVSQIYGTIF